MIPIGIKNSSSVEMFKNKISKWEPNDCDCKFFQDYLFRIGNVNLTDEQSTCCLNFDTGHRGSHNHLMKIQSLFRHSENK